jgi:hypothetical protein
MFPHWTGEPRDGQAVWGPVVVSRGLAAARFLGLTKTAGRLSKLYRGNPAKNAALGRLLV